jgi:histidyl-tRNA synthetase
MFRHERKQKGRWRQFYQIGAEALGSDHPAVDAEMIEMAMGLAQSIGVKASLLLNSVGCRQCRPKYTALLRKALHSEIANYCEDCRRRADTNPLRVFDCKIERCQSYIVDLPVISDNLCNECSEHFSRVRSFLETAGIPFTISPRLVRGLDYYVRTAFELVSGDLGSQNSIAGGGRYDGLSEVFGGPPVSAIGFAAGLDRLTMILPDQERRSGVWRPDLFIVHLGDAAFRKALEIARELRKRQQICYLDFAGGSMKRQMRLANKMNAAHVLIIGEDELKKERFAIKKMEDSTQWEVSMPELADYLQTVS